MKQKNKYLLFVTLMCFSFGLVLLSKFLFSSISPSPVGYPLLKQTPIFSSIVLFISLVLYVLGYKFLDIEKLSLKKIIIPSAILSIIALAVLPLVSNDLYTYFYRARILLKYHANPYFKTYNDFSFDQYFPLLNNVWSKHTAIYGPFFWIVMGFVSFITASKVFISIYAIKILFLTSFFASGFLIYKLTSSKKALYLFLLNPVVIFFSILDAHSDIFLLFLILSSLFLAKKAKENSVYIFLSWLLFLFAFLIKIYVLPVAIFVLYLIFKDRKQKDIFKILVFLAFESAFVIVLTYLPFWEGLETLKRYGEISRGYEGYFLGAFKIATISSFSKLLKVVQSVLKISFVLFYLYLIFNFVKSIILKIKIQNLFYLSALSYVFFVLVFINVWNPWYFIIGIGLFSLVGRGKMDKTIYFLSFLSIIYILLT